MRPQLLFEAKADHAFVCTEVEIVGNRIALKPISGREYARDIFRNFSSEVARYMVPKPPDRIEETLDFM